MALPEEIMARELSPQGAELVLKMRIAYKSEGKAGAAENYPPVLRKFLLWAESAGHAVNTLPAEAIEAFLDAYNSPTVQSRDILRSQLKSICNKITSEFGINLAHLEFRKPEAPNSRADRRARQNSRAMAQQSQEADIMAAAYAAQMETVQPLEETEYDMMEGSDDVSVAAAPVTEAYGLGGAPVAPPNASITPQVLVVQAPIPEGDVVPAPSAREKNARKAAAAKAETQAAQAPVKAATPVNSFIVNGVAFRGAYTRISRLADGLEPGVMPGSETILFVTPTSTIARSGDAVQYLQQFVLPQLRFHPNATQVTFILEELTEKRQTTGVRMEVSVGLTNFNASAGGNASGPQAFAPQGFGHAPAPAPAAPSASDPTLTFLLRSMENQIADAKRREQEAATKLEKESNTLMQMQLMQMQQRAADERRQMEERMLEMRMRADMSAGGYGGLNGVGAAPAATPLPDFFSQPPQPNPAEMLKPVLEQMGAMTTAMMQFAMRPPPPQKDAMETVLPIIMSMNQQMQQQQQAAADRQMEFMTALMTQGQKETPAEKFLTSQLQYMEKRLENKEANGSDFDRALGMIIKLKQVAPEIVGGGGGGGGLLEMLVENADGILGGAAKLLGAANSGGAPAPRLPAPQQAQQRQPQQLPPAQQDDAVPVKRAPKAAAPAPVSAAPVEVVVEAPAEASAEQTATPPEQVPQENPLTPIVTKMLAMVEEDEFDTEPLIDELKVYFTTIANMSEQHQQIAGQVMSAFETADVYEDVYEVAKFICATAGIASRGKHVRDLAQSIHGVYSDIYASFFDGKEKTLSDVEVDEDGDEDEAEGDSASA